ncbi:MAG: Nitroreductase family protein [Methanocella sp. PtaU1.Bin125]|nr:MAG: Nitroreductase family protein [Methanocella sp. PtaU1.Bin125]
MRMISLLCAIALPALIIGCFQLSGPPAGAGPAPEGETIRLPAPSRDSSTSIEQALSGRRSARDYRDEPLSLSDVSQLLWAAQGLSGTEGLRTAPSAGALYPLEVYVVAGNVPDLKPGVYRYVPREHAIVMVADGDKRADLSRVALGQPSVKDAPIDIVIAGVYERTTGKYDTPVSDELTGAKYPAGVKYVHMEAGHASQNVYLQCESLGLGTVAIGAFSEEGVRNVTGMSGEKRPLYIMPVGRT